MVSFHFLFAMNHSSQSVGLHKWQFGQGMGRWTNGNGSTGAWERWQARACVIGIHGLWSGAGVSATGRRLVYNNNWTIILLSIFLRWWLQWPRNHSASSRQEDGYQHGQAGNCEMVKKQERGAENYFLIICNNKIALFLFMQKTTPWIVLSTSALMP